MSFDAEAELRCIVCRKPLRGPNNVPLQALGRSVGPAHRACADLVHAGARVAALGAYTFGQKWLHARAPKLFTGLQLYRDVNRRMQAQLDKVERRRMAQTQAHAQSPQRAASARLLPRSKVKRGTRTR